MQLTRVQSLGHPIPFEKIKTSLTKSSNIPQIISSLPDHKKAHFKGNLVKLLGLYCVPESWSTLMEPFKRTSIRAEGP